jgi:hemoglobin-like flavoprotein
MYCNCSTQCHNLNLNQVRGAIIDMTLCESESTVTAAALAAAALVPGPVSTYYSDAEANAIIAEGRKLHLAQLRKRDFISKRLLDTLTQEQSAHQATETCSSTSDSHTNSDSDSDSGSDSDTSAEHLVCSHANHDIVSGSHRGTKVRFVAAPEADAKIGDAHAINANPPPVKRTLSLLGRITSFFRDASCCSSDTCNQVHPLPLDTSELHAVSGISISGIKSMHSQAASHTSVLTANDSAESTNSTTAAAITKQARHYSQTSLARCQSKYPRWLRMSGLCEMCNIYLKYQQFLPAYIPSKPCEQDSQSDVHVVKRTWKRAMSNDAPAYASLSQRHVVNLASHSLSGSSTAPGTMYVPDFKESPASLFFGILYESLFAALPDTRTMMAGINFRRQVRMLAGVIHGMIDYGSPHTSAEQKQQVEERMRRMGHMHGKMNITPHHFIVLGDCLYFTLSTMLREEYTAEVHKSWQRLYSSMLLLMVEDVVTELEKGNKDDESHVDDTVASKQSLTDQESCKESDAKKESSTITVRLGHGTARLTIGLNKDNEQALGLMSGTVANLHKSSGLRLHASLQSQSELQKCDCDEDAGGLACSSKGSCNSSTTASSESKTAAARKQLVEELQQLYAYFVPYVDTRLAKYGDADTTVTTRAGPDAGSNCTSSSSCSNN